MSSGRYMVLREPERVGWRFKEHAGWNPKATLKGANKVLQVRAWHGQNSALKDH